MTFQITANEYRRFQDMLEQSSGIVLGDGKDYLLSSRLKLLLAQQQLGSITALLDSLDGDQRLQEKVIEAMATHETQWFRDDSPYRVFRERLLPELAALRRPLRLWSAACSSGQEPYSLSIEIEEFRQRSPGRLAVGEQILATDISQAVLTQAKDGVYPSLAMTRGMPEPYWRQYFQPLAEGRWRLDSRIKQRVEFRQHNLQHGFDGLGRFDVIYCRNVLIYFAAKLQLDLIKRLHGSLNPQGYLVLGVSEQVQNLREYFETVPCHPGVIYRAR
jgi:chemotaxis protein methyltransferase CheR